MGVGKYSPTVSRWYAQDQKWHDKYCATDDDQLGCGIDQDGYDSYGYHHETDKDRAGYTELDYMDGCRWHDGEVDSYLYDMVYDDWAGKPVPTPNQEKPMDAEYRVIVRKGKTVKVFDKASHVAGWLLGRRISEHMLIKTDHKGDRVVDVTAAQADVAQIMIMLDQA